MKILLYRDDTIEIELNPVIAHLNRVMHSDTLKAGKVRFNIPEQVVSNPGTYEKISSAIKTEAQKADFVVFLTRKPYDNNHFWDSPPGKYNIVSAFDWEFLTKLPLNNGLVYFLCLFLAEHIGIRVASHQINTGCINDFFRDKRGIDIGMRSASVCSGCADKISKLKLSSKKQEIYKTIQVLLNEVSAASRKNTDILKYWESHTAESGFDVFLCHNSDDKPQIRTISNRLKKKSLQPWLDEEQLRPGVAWQDALESQISSIKSAAVFVGRSGFGPWQKREMRGFLSEFVERECPVIPVILAGAKTVPELPIFLKQLMWVDFRKTHPDPFGQLVWGITGVRTA